MCHLSEEQVVSIIFDEGVFAFDLCPPGMICKLDGLWLLPVSPTYGDTAGNRDEHIRRLVSHRNIHQLCQDFAPEITPALINRLSYLVNQFGLLCVFSGDGVSSLCVPPVLLDRAL